ncbi:MAG: cell division protein SepF [Rubrobacteraceae bacterium]
MAVKDSFGRMMSWFGFGAEDEYYEDEEEYGRDENEAYAGGAQEASGSSPAVRRINRAERSSSYGTSLGNVFGGESGSSGRGRNFEQQGQGHLKPVPDRRSSPARVSVVEPTSFNDAQGLADRFKREQPVILNLQNVDTDLSRRMVDFCSGLTYAMDGQIQTVASRVFLLTPRNVEVSAEERKRLAERAFFNQL